MCVRVCVCVRVVPWCAERPLGVDVEYGSLRRSSRLIEHVGQGDDGHRVTELRLAHAGRTHHLRDAVESEAAAKGLIEYGERGGATGLGGEDS